MSLFHLNSPEIGFNSKSALIKKITAHGGGEILMGNKSMAVLPNFVVVTQGENQYIDFGGELKVFLKEKTKFTDYSKQMYLTFGPYLRWGDAIYMVSRFSWNGFTVAVSYDFNLSDLTTVSNGNGAFEVMLGYKMDLGQGSTHNVRFR